MTAHGSVILGSVAAPLWRRLITARGALLAGTMVLGVMLWLPFHLWHKAPPVPSFYGEAAAFALGLLALAALLPFAGRLAFPRVAWLPLGFVGLLIVQVAARQARLLPAGPACRALPSLGDGAGTAGRAAPARAWTGTGCRPAGLVFVRGRAHQRHHRPGARSRELRVPGAFHGRLVQRSRLGKPRSAEPSGELSQPRAGVARISVRHRALAAALCAGRRSVRHLHSVFDRVACTLALSRRTGRAVGSFPGRGSARR